MGRSTLIVGKHDQTAWITLENVGSRISQPLICIVKDIVSTRLIRQKSKAEVNMFI